jgi:Tfp pilus assembly protein PilX
MTQPTKSRGATLILVLFFLAILSLLAVAAMEGAVADRERLVLQARETQAELLADSGIARARAQLRNQPETYKGETWLVPDAGPAGDGQVVIRVEPDTTSTLRVTVRAEYPAGRSTPLVARQTRSTPVPKPSDSDNGQTPQGDAR